MGGGLDPSFGTSPSTPKNSLIKIWLSKIWPFKAIRGQRFSFEIPYFSELSLPNNFFSSSFFSLHFLTCLRPGNVAKANGKMDAPCLWSEFRSNIDQNWPISWGILLFMSNLGLKMAKFYTIFKLIFNISNLQSSQIANKLIKKHLKEFKWLSLVQVLRYWRIVKTRIQRQQPFANGKCIFQI